MRLLAILALLASSPAFAAVEKTTARTTYGADIAVQVNLPANLATKAPAIVLAPGQGYHMDLPLLAELAAALEAKGALVFRFNWDYFGKPNGEPSPDLQKEAMDMQAVVRLAKADPRVDSAKVSLAGKSLGTLVAYYVFTHDEELRALSLLTPVCTASYDDNDQPLPAPIPSGEKNYPNLGDVKRPVLFASSSADPLCQTAHLAGWLGGFEGRFPFTIVGGNHSWDVVKGVDDETRSRNQANRAVGIGFVTSWLERFL